MDLFAAGPTRDLRDVRPYAWLVEPLLDDPSFLQRPMFGARACYLRGKLVLVLCTRGEDPWRGVLVPTAREHHASLLEEFPALAPHDVLGKWLYLPAMGDDFEQTAQGLLAHVQRDDRRIGVEPKRRAERKAAPRKSTRRARAKPRSR